MEFKFFSQINPQNELLVSLANLRPENPFCTPEFVASKAASDVELWAFYIRQDDELEVGCIGVLTRGKLTSRLEIVSTPDIDEDSQFWSELLGFCKEMRVFELRLSSFASTDTHIPPLVYQQGRKSRTEYVIDLAMEGLRDKLSSNHKRNVKRAERNGIEVHVVEQSSGCIEHAKLMSASMGRRQSRGEGVTTDVLIEPYKHLVESGAAFLHQATLNNEVLSSILILKSSKSGYYHSAGTSPEGMKLGASQYLILRTAELLYDKGADSFNLGGADDDQTGLIRFKQGFRPKEVKLESADFFLGSTIHRYLLGLIRKIRR